MRALLLSLLALGLFACEQPELWPVPAKPGPRPDGGLPSTRDAAVPPDAAAPTSQEEHYTLRLHDAPPAPLALNLTREEVQELLGAIADDVVLLELDPEPLLFNVLEAVKTACGTDWRRDVAEPRYDCAQTPLGRTFGANGAWRQSPEFALVRLLTMTPANVIVDGTSIEFLQVVSDTFGIGGGFSQILAESLDIARTDEIVPSEAVVPALREALLATHPGTTGDGRLIVTLGDVLADLSPLAEKLGPVGPHPGVLDPDFVPFGRVIDGDNFRMKAVANSNLRVLDGLKAAVGVDNQVIMEGPDRRPADTPLRFDFDDPDDFAIEGLVDEPRANLRFRILEHPKFVPACVGEEGGCRENMPGDPVGVDTVWHLRPWELEYGVTLAALLAYDALAVRNCYVACAIAEVSIGQGDDPPGWARFGVPLNLGPNNQYVWELISEVVQVGLHGPDERDRREGEANVAFTLTDVAVGITGAQAAEAVRPLLQRQAGAISDFLLGDFRRRSGPVDFVFKRASDTRPVLRFVAPMDLPEGTPYRWSVPGFFADAGLTQKVSATEIAGMADTEHEKWVVVPGETILFMADEAGRRWRLRVAGGYPGAPSIEIFVQPVEG